MATPATVQKAEESIHERQEKYGDLAVQRECPRNKIKMGDSGESRTSGSSKEESKAGSGENAAGEKRSPRQLVGRRQPASQLMDTGTTRAIAQGVQAIQTTVQI